MGGIRELAGVIMRVPGVIRCGGGRGVGLLVTADFCFGIVEGCCLTSGLGLVCAKGLSSSVRSWANIVE